MSCGPTTGWCRRVKLRQPYTPDQCQRCWLMIHSAEHRKNWGMPGPPLPVYQPGEGPPARLQRASDCGGCGKGKPLTVRDRSPATRPQPSAARGRSSPWQPPPPQPQAAPPSLPQADPIPARIVIGQYGWPELIDLQLRVIRATCGDVSVTVVSDNPKDTGKLHMYCWKHNAVLWQSFKRIGHCGGDLAVFHSGIQDAAAGGVRVIAKLSQRLIITRPNWLQEGARELLLSGLPAATRASVGRVWPDPLRTEGMLIDVEKWNKPSVLERLRPRKRYYDKPGGYPAEHQINDLLKEELGGGYWPWSLLPDKREERGEGILWHHSHTVEDYHRLAAQYGVTLPADFTVDGWGEHLARGVHDFG